MKEPSGDVAMIDKYKYHVVEFLENPFKDTERASCDFVCVPKSWVKWCKRVYNIVKVWYPTQDTERKIEEKVMKREKKSEQWQSFLCVLTDSTDSYEQSKMYIRNRKCSQNNNTEDHTTQSEKEEERPCKTTNTLKRKAPEDPDKPVQNKRSIVNEPGKSVDDVAGPSSQAFSFQTLPHKGSNKDLCKQDTPVVKSNDLNGKMKKKKEIVSKNLSKLFHSLDVKSVQLEEFVECCEMILELQKCLDQRVVSLPINTDNSQSALADDNIASASSDDEPEENDHDDDDDDNESKTKKSPRQPKPFVLPPNYDPNNSRWTLKHRGSGPGLVELVERSDRSPLQGSSHDKMDALPSTSKNATAEVPKLNEEKTDTDKVQKKMVLSPEHDENDSRWTLKYREPAPELVELVEDSGMYVNADKLAECEKQSHDCKTFARMLLTEIFTTSALSACSWTSVITNASAVHGGHARPVLDQHAINMLLIYVKRFGDLHNWTAADYQCCLNNMRQISLEMRRDRQREENYLDELMDNFSLTNFRQTMLEMLCNLQKEEEHVRDKHLGEGSQDTLPSKSKDATLEVLKLNEEETANDKVQKMVVLPSDHDANDSRWTIKYQEPAPGLVELMPHSGVYVNANELKLSLSLSNDCVTLARKLLNEIFTTSALNTCSWTGPTTEDSDLGGTNVKPGLNENAMETLLNFVAEFELENDLIIKTQIKYSQNILRQNQEELKPVENKGYTSSSLEELKEELRIIELKVTNALTDGCTSLSKYMQSEVSKLCDDFTEQNDKRKFILPTEYNKMDTLPSSSKDATAVVITLNEEQTDKVQKKMVLPPEYDENKSRWTLKYREPALELVELMEHSGVYVNANKLAECKKLSKDCHKLAEMLLFEVFTTKALNTCALPAALREAFGAIDENMPEDIPELDFHATETLLKFIEKYELETDWKVDDPPEYNENDSRWTLKYREPALGLFELVEHSGVYVRADRLAVCKRLTTDCHKFTKMLLFEVFTTDALSKCEFPAALFKATGAIKKLDMPELDLHATETLLKFITEYGLEKDWKVDDYGRILRQINTNNVIKRMRANERMIVPPVQYDANDSRWTLKYRQPNPNLVELAEHSGVYVNAENLAECLALSKDCVTLARRLLNEIFTTSALSACSVTNIASDLDSDITNLRPPLDAHAIKILLKFVAENALEKGWKITHQHIIKNCIQQKLEVMSYLIWNEEKVKDFRNFELFTKSDSIWTLVHRIPSQGTIELFRYSGVYVDAKNLIACKELSNDCTTLAVRLLTEVFKMSALRECSLSVKNRRIYETLPTPNTHLCNQQESCELDAHAEIILLHFVDEYGLKMGWPLLDFRFIRESMLQKIQEIPRLQFDLLKNQTNRWTLLYRELAPGLVELMEHSGVYVNADKLALYKNWDSIEAIVERLLYEVFTMHALGTCTLPATLCNDDRICLEPDRPELDLHATKIMLEFIEGCGNKPGRRVLDTRYVIALIYCRLEKERRRYEYE